MNRPRVFVTGSTGCIGNHAVNLLMAEGAEVYGFSRTTSPERQTCDDYHHVSGDLTDADAIRKALDETQPTHIIHLGALQTPDCRDYPMLGLEVNVLGTGFLFRACQELKLSLERFVFASSSAVNGPRSLYGSKGVHTDDPIQPFNLYGYWKVAGEGMARAFHQATGVSTVSLRLATTYGPGRDRGFTAAMTTAIKAVAWQKDFQVPYRGRENYHFSLDVGAGFVRAALDPFVGYGTFNLLGETHRVEDFMKILEDQAKNFGIFSHSITIADDAEESPFIYDLNDELTGKTFPRMPRTPLKIGIEKSLNYFLSDCQGIKNDV